MEQNYSLDELMVVEAARYINDGDIVLVGTGLPFAAGLFALKSSAPNMCYVVETGPIAPEVIPTPISVSVLISCEEIISTDEIRRDPDRTTIPYLFVDAVVEQPWGAYPTSTFGRYEHDEDHLRHYQACARAGGEAYDEYMKKFIYDCETFDDHLEKAAGIKKLNKLRSIMQSII